MITLLHRNKSAFYFGYEKKTLHCSKTENFYIYIYWIVLPLNKNAIKHKQKFSVLSKMLCSCGATWFFLLKLLMM